MTAKRVPTSPRRRPQARSCRRPSFETRASHGSSDEVCGIEVRNDDDQAVFVVCCVTTAARSAFGPIVVAHVGRRCCSVDDVTMEKIKMATEEKPGQVHSRIVFTALICAAYVYVAFWVGFVIEAMLSGHNG